MAGSHQLKAGQKRQLFRVQLRCLQAPGVEQIIDCHAHRGWIDCDKFRLGLAFETADWKRVSLMISTTYADWWRPDAANRQIYLQMRCADKFTFLRVRENLSAKRVRGRENRQNLQTNLLSFTGRQPVRAPVP